MTSATLRAPATGRPLLLHVLLAIGIASTTLMAQTSFGDGPLAVEVNAQGLLVRVPEAGLALVDGPLLTLTSADAEWFGVRYRLGDRAIAAVGVGAQADWAGRPPVRTIATTAEGSRLIVTTLAGDLRIETTFRIEPGGPYLLVSVRLHNTGDHVLRDIVYTREWRTGAGAGWTFPPDLGLDPAPHDIARAAWMLDDLAPGASGGVGVTWSAAGADEGGPTVVPLEPWTGGSFPQGLVFGDTNGISWGDHDADGWPDVFALQSGNLWRNLGGSDWALVANLAAQLPFTTRRYGASFGDYDKDGLPDIATEPRNEGVGGDSCFHLLKNAGNTVFVDVATFTGIIDVQPCQADTETLCWGDVDGDLDLDLFLPTYPEWAFGGPGNFFLENLGPVGPQGNHAFAEVGEAIGLDNPLGTARPESAQMVDMDFDGDLDIFSNGTLYQNVSTPGMPAFVALPETSSGLGNSDVLEEGALFFDYDMDGDDDLVTVYALNEFGVVIWENRGDGTLVQAPADTVEDPFIGLGLGASAADWDGDGDLDFTTRQIFRRNMLVETGQIGFTKSQHGLDPADLVAATPAWADWDKDGDLDCALGNWFMQGKFLENTLYGAATPAAKRRHVRVRVVLDDVAKPRGLEHEYGANVELTLLGDADDGLRRRRFVTSSGGYLTQDEYTLTFFLPPDPSPSPVMDVHFALTVDFPSLPARGLHRVDSFVNPALADIDLAALDDREIVVFRSGTVRIDDAVVLPDPLARAELVTTTRGLALPTAAGPLPEPVPTPGGNRYTGLAISTPAGLPLELREILLDGQLRPPVAQCGGGEPFNVAVWDVTDPASPVLVPDGRLSLATRPENRRSRWLVDLTLQPERDYRVVARVSERRATPTLLPLDQGAVVVQAGLDFTDLDPCSGTNVVAAPAIAAGVSMALRLGVRSDSPWLDLGLGKPGTGGSVPQLTGFGPLTPFSSNGILLSDALPLAPVTLVLGLENLSMPFSGGVLVPSFDVPISGLVTDDAGELLVPITWPDNIPAGLELFFQCWIDDPGGQGGFAASNGLKATAG